MQEDATWLLFSDVAELMTEARDPGVFTSREQNRSKQTDHRNLGSVGNRTMARLASKRKQKNAQSRSKRKEKDGLTDVQKKGVCKMMKLKKGKAKKGSD